MKTKKSLGEKIIFFGSVLSGLLAIFTALDKFQSYFKSVTGITITPTQISITTEVLNIFVLLIFYLLIKSKYLTFSTDQIQKLAETLSITEKQARFNIERVNKLIEQLVFCLGGWILFLFFFYLIQLIEDSSWFTQVHITNFSFFLGFLENLSNIISAAFVYLAFNVLFDITLDEKNSPKIYYRGTIIFLISYTVTYIYLILGEQSSSPSQVNTTDIFRLICGVYNGLAMGLLFGRFISMEYFFKDLELKKEKFNKRFYYVGSIFILPLYVIAQPMYGMFKIVQYDPLLFKAVVFVCCFIGKTFFLFMFYKYINKKWFHVYLHLMLANHLIPRNIAMSFPQINDLDIESSTNEP